MEELGMARQSKRDYLRSIHKRYRQARRQEKSAMLEEFARICGYNRKYAIWLLKRPLPQPKAHRRRGKRGDLQSGSHHHARQSLGSLGLSVLAAPQGGLAAVASVGQETFRHQQRVGKPTPRD